MSFNINTFGSVVSAKNGPLKTSKYRVLFPPPPVLVGRPGTAQAFADSEGLHFWCQDAQLPGYQLTLGGVRRNTYGPNEPRPFAPNFQQLQLTFMMDADFFNWSYFNAWLESIIPHDLGDYGGLNLASQYGSGKMYELEYKHRYTTDILIEVYAENENMKPTKTIILRDAFPSNINAVQMSWGDNNSYAAFTIFIEYLDWQIGTAGVSSQLFKNTTR